MGRKITTKQKYKLNSRPLKMDLFDNSTQIDETGSMMVRWSGDIVVALQTVRCILLDMTTLEDQKAVCIKLTGSHGEVIQEFQVYGRLMELMGQMINMLNSPELFAVIMAILALYYTFKGGQALLDKLRGN